MEPTHDDLEGILNAQTGQLNWQELEPHFAKGVVITVSKDLDLIEVAAAVVEDNKDQVSAWMESKQIAHAVDKDAIEWGMRDPMFWAVVSAPWVLVQEIS
jgi:hypothetical protein